MTPRRLQFHRTKGFNMQEHSHSVNGLPGIRITRPGKWGNPFREMGDMVYIDAGYRRKILSRWVWYCFTKQASAVELYRLLLTDGFTSIERQKPDIRHWIEKVKRLDFSELKGKNLYCFCGEAECHGDVLLKIANQ